MKELLRWSSAPADFNMLRHARQVRCRLEMLVKKKKMQPPIKCFNLPTGTRGAALCSLLLYSTIIHPSFNFNFYG